MNGHPAAGGRTLLSQLLLLLAKFSIETRHK
jgi:hypothetical protein